MPIKIGINGFGRIGRLVYRAGMNNSNLEFVAVNDVTNAKTLAHLLKYDSVHGVLDSEIKAEGNNILVDGKKMEVFSEKDPSSLPWKKLGVDFVVESTGKFRTAADAKKHIQAGAKKVLISAPAKALALVLLELKEKLDGVAFSVPVTTGSIVDLTSELSKNVTTQEFVFPYLPDKRMRDRDGQLVEAPKANYLKHITNLKSNSKSG